MKFTFAISIAVLLAGLSALSGCGQTGPLYRADLPDSQLPESDSSMDSVEPVKAEQDPNDF